MNHSQIYLRHIVSKSKSRNQCFAKQLNNFNKYSITTIKDWVDQTYKFPQDIKNANKIRLWSIEGIIDQIIRRDNQTSSYKKYQQSLIQILNSSQGSANIVTNRHFSSISNFFDQKNIQIQQKQTQSKQRIINPKRNLIEDVNKTRNWGFIPNFFNVIKNHQQRNNEDLYLFIGDYNGGFVRNYLSSSYITLEQLCAIYPQKVPLSYRSRLQIQKIKQSVAKRINNGRQNKISLKQQPKFNEIIIINDKIKMWDQAYQVMLDQLPMKIRIPFHVIESSSKQYKLNLNDFIEGFKTSHKIIHPNIRLQIQQQNTQQFIYEVLKNIKNLQKKNYQIQIMDPALISTNMNLNKSQQLNKNLNVKKFINFQL